jgi:hypothetical protein
MVIVTTIQTKRQPQAKKKKEARITIEKKNPHVM